jgi:pSer/pThr/pTyr-binding forkhead associated (FHA) protein
MQQCANCGHQNRAGVVFCENCGASLLGKAPLDTKSVQSSSDEEKEQLGIDSSVLTDVKVQGASVFKPDDALRLDIEGSTEPIVLKPKIETIFGRRDPATGAVPDVDLTPFAGYRMGVSRRHAAIRHGDESNLNIWDLGSSNGTFLNGQRLSAHRPYRLHDGDELRLGQMMIRVHFEAVAPAGQAAQTAATDAAEQAQPAAPEEKKPEAAAEAPALAEKPEPKDKQPEAEQPIGLETLKPAADTGPLPPKTQPQPTLQKAQTEPPESPKAPPEKASGDGNAAATVEEGKEEKGDKEGKEDKEDKEKRD